MPGINLPGIIQKQKMDKLMKERKINEVVTTQYQYGGYRIFINDVEVELINENGIIVGADIIGEIEFKHLGMFEPIYIDAPEIITEPEILEIYNYAAEYCLYVIDELTVDAVVTVFEAEGIEEDQIEDYRRMYSDAVNEQEDLMLLDDGQMDSETFSFLVEENKDNPLVRIEQFGPVQFSVSVNGVCFKDVYKPLLKILKELDKETRKKMKKRG